MEKQSFITVNNSGKGKVEMVISGFLTPFKNSAAEIVSVFSKLESEYDDITINLMNCYGGEVFEGIPAFNKIKNSPKKPTTKVEGLAASMGAILYMAGHEREVTKYSRLMLHRAQGASYGNVDQMRNYADEMEKLENDLIDIISECSGIKKDEVKKSFFDGNDHYISADDAISKYKFAHRMVNGNIKSDIPEDVLKFSNVGAVASFYNKQIEISNPKSNNEMKNLISFLAVFATANIKLNPDASEEDVLREVTKVVNENKRLLEENGTLKTKVEAAENATVDTMIQNAIDLGKITAAQKDTFTGLAKKDFAATKAVLDGMLAHKSVTSQLAGGKENEEVANSWEDPKYKNWGFADFQKKASDVLAEMKEKNPELYNKLRSAVKSKSTF